jgi:acetoin:2,6-dichlorophenolindophenol oxidoreductase subunit beta
MAELTYRDAVAAGIAQEMERDERVVFLGEDVAAAGGVFKATVGLLEKFGPRRVRDCPIAEQAILGAAMGAAMTGLKPIAEIMFSDFLAVCWDIVANEMAKMRYMTNGQVTMPVVIRTANGAGSRFGAQHSQAVENWAMAVPGLKVVAPAFPADVKGLIAAAVRDPDPVIVFEQKSLYSMKGEVPDGELVDELGKARVLRKGNDCTIVALALMVHRALAAAEVLEKEHGISCTVVGGGQDRPARDRGGESAAMRLGRRDRVDRRRRVLLVARRPDHPDYHAAHSIALGRPARGQHHTIGGAGGARDPREDRLTLKAEGGRRKAEGPASVKKAG